MYEDPVISSKCGNGLNVSPNQGFRVSVDKDFVPCWWHFKSHQETIGHQLAMMLMSRLATKKRRHQHSLSFAYVNNTCTTLYCQYSILFTTVAPEFALKCFISTYIQSIFSKLETEVKPRLPIQTSKLI